MTDCDNQAAIDFMGRCVIRVGWIVGACIIAAIVLRVSLGAV